MFSCALKTFNYEFVLNKINFLKEKYPSLIIHKKVFNSILMALLSNHKPDKVFILYNELNTKSLARCSNKYKNNQTMFVNLAEKYNIYYKELENNGNLNEKYYQLFNELMRIYSFIGDYKSYKELMEYMDNNGFKPNINCYEYRIGVHTNSKLSNNEKWKDINKIMLSDNKRK